MFFAHKEILLLLPLLLIYVAWYILSHRKEATMRIPSALCYAERVRTLRTELRHAPFVLRTLALAMLIIVLARPQSSGRWQEKETEGINIVLALDISTSMLSEDLSPNRITAAKRVASRFVSNSPNDNIGLSIFAGEAFTQCPLTIDHAALLSLMEKVGCDLPAQGLIDDGTAIGMGLTNAISRLNETDEGSKVVILLTDGSNNSGDISPTTAADIAKAKGVRVYTIGVGTNGTATYPMPLPGGGVQRVQIPVEIDEAVLRQIATTTGGRYYRATSTTELDEIYDDIGKLEKAKIQVKQYERRYELYQPFGLAALLLLLLELLLRILLLRRIP